jgi:hypothetical protein
VRPGDGGDGIDPSGKLNTYGGCSCLLYPIESSLLRVSLRVWWLGVAIGSVHDCAGKGDAIAALVMQTPNACNAALETTNRKKTKQNLGDEPTRCFFLIQSLANQTWRAAGSRRADIAEAADSFKAGLQKTRDTINRDFAHNPGNLRNGSCNVGGNETRREPTARRSRTSHLDTAKQGLWGVYLECAGSSPLVAMCR